jgi:polynucleotide 5'-kinase involved in rRNA processing
MNTYSMNTYPTDLRVTVSGRACSGKSAMAQLIAETLLKHGFQVDLEETEHPLRDTVVLSEIVGQLKDQTQVVIDMKQTPRGSNV